VKLTEDSYGIRAFDTSAYYGPSEIVLGRTLEALRDEFPRSSYKLVRPLALIPLPHVDPLYSSR
jgi:D-arabinose 1-dehydrogenase